MQMRVMMSEASHESRRLEGDGTEVNGAHPKPVSVCSGGHSRDPVRMMFVKAACRMVTRHTLCNRLP